MVPVEVIVVRVSLYWTCYHGASICHGSQGVVILDMVIMEFLEVRGSLY